MEHEPLVLHTDPGGSVRLRYPIPPLSIVSLHALTHAQLREWIIVDGDAETGDRLTICDHRFVVVGWLTGRPGGVILQHLGGP